MMMRRLLPPLLLSIALIASIVSSALAPPPASAPPRQAWDVQESAHPAAAAPEAAIRIIAAHPVFTPSRQPPGSAQAQAAAMPRLTGTVISPAGRRAIFALEPHSLILEEGGRIDRYTIRAITAGSVELDGPGGPVILHPAYVRMTAETPAAMQAPPSSAGPGSNTDPAASVTPEQPPPPALLDMMRRQLLGTEATPSGEPAFSGTASGR